jgi:cytochrome b6-f complex iron-sulfur subunit
MSFSRQLPIAEPIADITDGLPRREFLSAATLAAVSVVLGACSSDSGFSPKAPNQEPPAGTSGSTLTVTVSAFPALANVGGIAAVGSLGNKPVAVVRTGASSFTALSRICTHAGCDVGIQGNAFVCPCHGSEFDSSGQATKGPAEASLQRFNVAVAAGGATLTIS